MALWLQQFEDSLALGKGFWARGKQDVFKKWGSYISQLDQKGFSDSLGDVLIYLVEKLISHPSVD